MSGKGDVVGQVRERYGKIAAGKVSGCCGSTWTSTRCRVPPER